MWSAEPCFVSLLQENLFDLQEALQAIHMRQEMLREQLASAKSKGEETVGRNLQVIGRFLIHNNAPLLSKSLQNVAVRLRNTWALQG